PYLDLHSFPTRRSSDLWLGGISNTISFKGITVSALIDIKKGGDIYDMGTSLMRQNGITDESAVGREEGVIGIGVKNIGTEGEPIDRKSTRLNSSHVKIS